MKTPEPTPNLQVFLLLWKTARRRSKARQLRQRELMSRKKGSSSNPLAGLMVLLSIGVMCLVHGALGWLLIGSVETAGWVAQERDGKLVIPSDLWHDLEGVEDRDETENRNFTYGYTLRRAGDWRSRNLGGSREVEEAKVRRQYEDFGTAGFTNAREGDDTMEKIASIQPIFWPMAGFVLLWWLTMIVCQGEGLELDIQRRRHPMWEWIQSHPVRPVAAFAADLLSPMMANPVYFSAPIFWGVIFGKIFGVGIGLFLAVPVGLCFALAASALNKALEISVMLRLSPRNRGAVLGLMSWLGYAGMMLPLFTFQIPQLKVFLIRLFAPIAGWSDGFPIRGLIAGWGDVPSAWQVLITGIVCAGMILSVAIWIAWWGANQGLQGTGGTAVQKSVTTLERRWRWVPVENPLYRKELLWFWRDKGAVIQALLIPLTIASFQVFNLRGFVNNAVGTWNGISGAAVVCGTYFLLVLGPRSLASEGAALWIATTWPCGMEDLLKAKARLWWFLSSGIVLLILAVAVWMFPQDWWRIMLVFAGWIVFGRSLAEKAVTLATVSSSSGEPEPAPKGRQWAAMLGTFVFSAGIFTGNWSLAVVGVVFSSLTASAMWQNFRARLPYLFDPWSEKIPPAPSLMHAMIAVASMVEAIGLGTVLLGAFQPEGGILFVQTLSYGMAGIITWLVMQNFLAGRSVFSKDIWNWDRPEQGLSRARSFGIAIAGGLLIAGMALLYLEGLRIFPPTESLMRTLDAMAPAALETRILLLLMAVGMAPLAEEYLFRGLLFRALDRERGGWHAILWSSAYFAIYHPPVSWLPVFVVGVFSAWLFRKSGTLWPSVLLHMTYNAVVCWFQ